ncbi:hypothetical protein D9615_002373 [Tricholomella constricta]|uniref:BZIP domain-containing protein n=1 Tax=Tricholomella constricta TaxID=117010 RepID=A0A8H5HMC1_9AGAR|nr:hypothetical protein D9615_002373 [Tricholomella constricta]
MWEPASPFLAQFMLIVTQPQNNGEYTSHQLPDPPLPPFPQTTCGRVSRMTRGRKKDFTIPPTRALVQQRDYRARRAQYVTDLEERVRKAEEENVQLRNELAAARAGQVAPPLALDSQTAHASSELLHNLSVASSSLARFHQLAFPEPHHGSQLGRPYVGSLNHPFSEHPATTSNVLRPASFPSPAPSPPYAHPGLNPTINHNHNPPRRKRLYREDSPESVVARSEEMSYSRYGSRSESPASDCCGGIMDCRELIERVDGASDCLDDSRSNNRPRTDPPEFPPILSHDTQRRH